MKALVSLWIVDVVNLKCMQMKTDRIPAPSLGNMQNRTGGTAYVLFAIGKLTLSSSTLFLHPFDKLASRRLAHRRLTHPYEAHLRSKPSGCSSRSQARCLKALRPEAQMQFRSFGTFGQNRLGCLLILHSTAESYC